MRATTAAAFLIATSWPVQRVQALDVKWCTVSIAEATKCAQMMPILRTAAAAAAAAPAAAAPAAVRNTYSCVPGADEDACVSMIAAGTAHLMSLDGGAAFEAAEASGIQVVVAEKYGEGTTASAVEYHSIAVVRAADGIKSWEDLRGKVSGHTGYRKTAGWFMPVGALLEAGVLTSADANSTMPNDIEAVKGFFGGSCAPGVAGAAEDGVSAICDACAGTCTQDADEPYQDYAGSFQCLQDGVCDVAFTKEGTVPPEVAVEYQLLCAPGSTPAVAPVDEYTTCNLAVVPAHIVVTTPDMLPADIAAVQADLVEASLLPGFAALFYGDDANADGLLFDSKMVGLQAAPSSVRGFMGSSYDNFGAIRDTDAVSFGSVPVGSSATWCTTTDEEHSKCLTSLARPLNAMVSNELKLKFACAQLGNLDDCMAAMSAGSVDLVALDGGQVFDYAQQYGVQVVSAEQTTSEVSDGVEYYAVAVVRESAPNDFAEYQGGRSCHTGYRKTAGWFMPVGRLVASGIMPYVDESDDTPNDMETVAAFFSGGSCAPGPDGDDGATSICTNCKGDCSQDAVTEPYYDYAGALLCLSEDDGDDRVVAFTRHDVFATAGVSSEGYKLLCPGGGSAPATDYATCNLATVPSHAVVTSAAAAPGYVLAAQAALEAAPADATFAAAFVGAAADGVLLSPGLVALRPLPAASARAYMGGTYDVYAAVAALDAGSGGSSDGGGGDGGGGDQTAAIVLGVALALVTVVAAAALLRMRRSLRHVNKELSKAQGFTQEWAPAAGGGGGGGSGGTAASSRA